MSPEMKRDFEHEWAELSPRLRMLLARKKVLASRHDDLVQEVALRLLLMWPQVDRARPLWPLAVTIAMNLIRDESRTRPVREVYGEVPEVLDMNDVETSGLARIELDRVRRAMVALTNPQRDSLLKEIGVATGNGHSIDAEKMLRLRARRKLSQVLRDVSTVVAVRYRRSLEGLQGLLPLRDGLAQGSVCLICLIAGITGGVVVETSPSAEAAPLEGSNVALISGAAPSSMEVMTNAWAASQSLRPDAVAATDTVTSKSAGASARRDKGASGGASGLPLSPPSLLPNGSDDPVSMPGSPPLPSGDEPTIEPPTAEPPPAPAPPAPPVQGTAVVQAVVEEATGAVIGK